MKKITRKKKNKSYTMPCQICDEVCILETHHIFGRKVCNYDFSWNLVDICPNCHTKVHNSIIQIHGWVNTTNGKFLEFDILK